jgi:hypothetical protein
MAGRGVTIFVPSGDGGSSPDANGNYGGPVQVESPANDPSVTAVGGTSLYLNSNGSVANEPVWFEGSGGGESAFFSRPFWQSTTGMSGSGRLVPDVALDADPNTGVLVVLNGELWQFVRLRGMSSTIRSIGSYQLLFGTPHAAFSPRSGCRCSVLDSTWFPHGFCTRRGGLFFSSN